jgi:uncharacterized protein (DUF1501 family)
LSVSPFISNCSFKKNRAKVTTPLLIKGTVDDINFVLTADGKNYARMRGKTGITAQEF